ncbi:MAG TPA: type II secretion system protein [Fibrobacteria bacterium]|nr:type II secretion system protein [Fibrobacteria bacterium]HOX50627.1 type II secretion system protein [Fibrobacteria bacterium]
MRRCVRGVTLVELLVAMALAGVVATMVFGWMRHASKVSHASQLRDDREQQLATLRDALFQDGTIGQILTVQKDAIEFVRRRDTLLDTARWTVSDTGLVRSGRAYPPTDRVESWEIVPRVSGGDPLEDPWSLLDKDLDGKVDRESMGMLDAVEIRLVVVHRGFPATDRMVTDTLRLVAPVRGPG